MRLLVQSSAKFNARLHVWTFKNLVDRSKSSDRLYGLRKAGFAKGFRKPTEHNIQQYNGRYRCLRCLRSAHTYSHVLRSACKPFDGHRFHSIGGTIFCALCGAYSRTKVRLLHQRCRRRPTDLGRKVLEKLWAGKDPVTGAYLGVHCPFVTPAVFADIDCLGRVIAVPVSAQANAHDSSVEEETES